MSKKDTTPSELSILPEIPYAKYTRNNAGLIGSIKYQYNEDGSINYKKLINPKYIVLNKERKELIEKKYGSNFDDLQRRIQEGQQDPDDIEDGYKLILLAGIKELAKIRGYTNVDYFNNATTYDYVATKCTIYWIPNYETNNLSVMFSSLADAHSGNTKGQIATTYLNTIAENRAFVRAVRNFLGIHVLGFDEIGSATPTEETTVSNESFAATDPRFVLVKKFDQLKTNFKIGWPVFQKWLAEKKNVEEATNWKTINDVPINKAYDIVGFVAEAEEQQKKKKEKES